MAQASPMHAIPRPIRLAPVLFCLLGPARAATAETCDAARLPGVAGRFLVLAEGDSITAGDQSSDGRSYVQRTCLLRANGIETKVTAVSRGVLGSPADAPGANSLYGRMATDNAWLAAKAGRTAILSILIGRNDLVGYGGGSDAYADDLAAYIAKMRRAGWDRVVVATVLPSTWEPFDRQRDDLNSILLMPGWAKAHGIDAIADFAASPSMGRDGAAADKTFYADGIHPNDHGYETLAPIYGAALRKLMTGASHGR